MDTPRETDTPALPPPEPAPPFAPMDPEETPAERSWAVKLAFGFLWFGGWIALGASLALSRVSPFTFIFALAIIFTYALSLHAGIKSASRGENALLLRFHWHRTALATVLGLAAFFWTQATLLPDFWRSTALQHKGLTSTRSVEPLGGEPWGTPPKIVTRSTAGAVAMLSLLALRADNGEVESETLATTYRETYDAYRLAVVDRLSRAEPTHPFNPVPLPPLLVDPPASIDPEHPLWLDNVAAEIVDNHLRDIPRAAETLVETAWTQLSERPYWAGWLWVVLLIFTALVAGIRWSREA